MKVKRIPYLVLVLIMVILSVSCSSTTGESVSVDDLIVPTYKDDKIMTLISDLPPDQSNREMMQLYKDCGLNAIPISEDFFKANSDSFWTAIDLCEELGIDAYIRQHESEICKDADGNVLKMQDENNLVRHTTYFERKFPGVDFTKYPSVKGFYIFDEPTWKQLTEVKASYVPWFNENYGDSGMIWIANYLGGYSSMIGNNSKNEKVTYDEYVRYYLDGVLANVRSSNKFFGIDSYPLRNNGTANYVADGFLHSTLNASINAHNAGVDFSAYIQAFWGFRDTRELTSPKDIRYLAGLNMACGAKRLHYFGFREVVDQGTPYTCMTKNGEPNDLYYYIKTVNQEILNFDHVFLSFDWKGLKTFVGTGSRLASPDCFLLTRNLELQNLTNIQEVKSKFDLVVGEFKDNNGNLGFMVANYDEPSNTRSNKTTIKFNDAEGALIYRKGVSEVVAFGDNTLTIDLEAGENAFIIPLQAK